MPPYHHVATQGGFSATMNILEHGFISGHFNNNTNWDNTHIPDSLGHVIGDVHLLHLPIEVDRLPLC